MARLLITCLLLCCFTTPLLAAPPSRVQAVYDLLYRNSSIQIGTITETFTRSQNHYAIESISNPTGLLKLIKPETLRVTSTGLMTPHGLRPITFISERKLESDRNTRADLNWDSKQITLIDRNGSRHQSLPDGTQDRLSAMYQFMFVSLKNISSLSFHMTNGSKLDIYNYTLTHGQNVTVPIGTFNAIYAASPIEPGNSRTEIWLAPDRYNLPVKLVITDPDGKTLTQVLTRLELQP